MVVLVIQAIATYQFCPHIQLQQCLCKESLCLFALFLISIVN